jgi:hypothetical protein
MINWRNSVLRANQVGLEQSLQQKAHIEAAARADGATGSVANSGP